MRIKKVEQSEWKQTKQLLSDPIELGGLGEGRRVRALVVVLPFLFSSLESYSAHAPLKTPFLLLFLVFAPGEQMMEEDPKAIVCTKSLYIQYIIYIYIHKLLIHKLLSHVCINNNKKKTLGFNFSISVYFHQPPLSWIHLKTLG